MYIYFPFKINDTKRIKRQQKHKKYFPSRLQSRVYIYLPE